MRRNWVIIAILLLPGALALQADILTADFDAYSDGTEITNQYSGMLFSNAVVWSAGITLDEAEFPPHSDPSVAIDANGPISITFDPDLAVSFSAYFTYAESLTLTAYDALNNVVGTANSLFSQNFTSSGNPPNELISLDVPTGFAELVITGDPAGVSFAMDDVSVTTAAGTTPPPGVPEPSTFAVLCAAIGLIVLARKYFVQRA